MARQAADLPRREAALAVDDPALHRLQHRHFLLYDILPVPAALLAFALAIYEPIGAPELTAMLVMWVLTGLGMSVGYHRLFCHKSFEAAPVVRAALAVCGAMAGQGGVVSWVAMHRRHHERSDATGDMHSPNLHGPGRLNALRGLLHAHLLWMYAHPYPNAVHYAPDLLRDRRISFISRHYQAWVIAGLLLPALACAAWRGSWYGLISGFLWGGMVRMLVLEHAIWALNSLCHRFGSRRYVTRDNSRNLAWLAPLIFGESWHHNHHAFPQSAWFGLAWHRIDPGYWFILLLRALGLARDVRVPTPEQLQARLQPATPNPRALPHD